MNAPGLKRYLGWILLATSLSIVVAAGLLGWSAWDRADAVDLTRRALAAQAAGRRDDAKRLANEALRLGPELAPALIACDPRDAAATAQRLRGVRARTDEERQMIETAKALPAIFAGEMVEVNGADGRVLGATKNGSAFPKLDGAPSMAALALGLHRRLQAGWAFGDRAMVHQAAGALLLLQPRRQDAAELAAVVAATGNGPASTLVMRAMAIDDGKRRRELMEQLIPLAGPHRDDCARLALDLEKKADPAADLAQRITAGGDPAAQVEEALRLGNHELALKAASRLPADRRDKMRYRIALSSGDVGILLDEAKGRPEAVLRLGKVNRINGWIVAQFSNDDGFVPRGGLTVRLDGVSPDMGDVVLRGTQIAVRPNPVRAKAAMFEVVHARKVIAKGPVLP